jgi:hypothetical protein
VHRELGRRAQEAHVDRPVPGTPRGSRALEDHAAHHRREQLRQPGGIEGRLADLDGHAATPAPAKGQEGGVELFERAPPRQDRARAVLDHAGLGERTPELDVAQLDAEAAQDLSRHAYASSREP